MNVAVGGNVHCAKGAICYCLDELSKGRGARSRLARLRDELAAQAPAFNGLTEVFDRHLLSHVIADHERPPVVTHLQRHWFDQASPDAFFPGVPVASIYAQGVHKALDLALAGRRVVPLNAWWLLDFPEVKLISLADVEAGATIGGRVTLLILTPRPQFGSRPTRTPIMGETAQAMVTEHRDNRVRTLDVRRA
ncbi:MAG: hypothetical protein ACREF3_05810 [Acetobacteraceae bacterium]